MLLTTKLSNQLTNQLTNKLPKSLTTKVSTSLPFIAPLIDDALIQEFYGNHVAAITGAGSGIGRELARILAENGCNLALTDINADNLSETAQLLADSDIKITTTVLDVSDKQAVDNWANSVMQAHGQVNFIFNNAGVALASTVEGMTMDELEWVMDINFWGVVYGTKAFLPLIKQSVALNEEMHGHIINVSSLFGLTAVPTQSAYNASKFAVRGFSECLRQELAIQKSPVSVTCVHPGGIKTNIANSARTNENVTTLGQKTGADSLKKINKMLKFDPNTAAQVILMAVANNQARCLVGDDAKMVDLVQRLFPSDYAIVMNKSIKFAKRMQRKLVKKKR